MQQNTPQYPSGGYPNQPQGNDNAYPQGSNGQYDYNTRNEYAPNNAQSQTPTQKAQKPFPTSGFPAATPTTKKPQNMNKTGQKPLNIPKPIKNQKSIGGKINSFLRNIGIIVIILILAVSSLLAYIIIFPEQRLSQEIVSRSPLDRYISFNSETNNDPEETIQTVQPGNIFFGLEEDDLSSQQSTVLLVSQTIPSVLSIRVSTEDSALFRSSADGTGFIASTNGLVVTNRHVVSQACGDNSTNINITAQDAQGNAYQLELLSIDPVEDIAILQIRDADGDLPSVLFGDSDELKLGEEVVAIGNALGQLNNTVTRGIVSGLDRTLQTGLIDDCTNTSVIADGVIQTDAAINRGNSGGPLFDASGQLIGMNTFGTTEAQSIGFAIPSNSILYALRSYQDNEIIIRPRLGVYTQVITPVDVEDLSWLPVSNGEIITAPTGASAITPGSAAANAGLQEGDIIVAVSGENVEYTTTNQRPLKKLLQQYNPDDQITLTIRKRTGIVDGNPTYEAENTEVQVTLGGISFDDF